MQMMHHARKVSEVEEMRILKSRRISTGTITPLRSSKGAPCAMMKLVWICSLCRQGFYLSCGACQARER